MPEYEKHIKLSENVIPHDLIEIGGALFEVLAIVDYNKQLRFELICIATVAEQRKSSETLEALVFLPRGLMIEILK